MRVAPWAQTGVMTALELRDELARLEAERALAISSGMARSHAYLADLEELEIYRGAYVVEAVAEIATRRGELFGRQVGGRRGAEPHPGRPVTPTPRRLLAAFEATARPGNLILG